MNTMNTMNTMNKYTALTAVLLLSSTSTFAAKWTSEAELGVIITDGNSETQNTNAKISAVRNTDKWKHAGSLEALASSNTITDDTTGKKVDTTTGEKYSANAKVDYKLNSADYLFAAADYIDDRFSGFVYQATVSAGYGRIIVDNEKQYLNVEAGPGKRYFKVSQDPITGTRTPSDDENIIHTALNYAYIFNEDAKFTQNLIIDAGEDVTISESISALQAQVAGKLAMKASLTIRDSSEVPVDTEERDTTTALTLVYSLK
jgi:putative salt-induced outer membrane protein YdiY